MDDSSHQPSNSEKSRFGAIGVLGRANAGKSSLINKLVGEQVSIVSARPQTTRRRILGILTQGTSQIVFCDTPGIHAVHNQLDQFMVGEIESTLKGLDGALYLVDASDPRPQENEKHIAHLLQQGNIRPLFLVLNKIDLVAPPLAKELVETLATIAPFDQTFCISVQKGIGLKALLKKICRTVPLGEFGYSAECFTNQNEREIVEETIREEVLKRFYHEVPHSLAVQIQQFNQRDNGKTFIEAELVLERQSHKKIIVGKDGAGIKSIGQGARRKLNRVLGRDIFLQLWVKVRPNWRKSEEWVRRLGYKPT